MSTLEEIADRLVGVLPPQVGQLRAELHRNFRAVLQSRLHDLNVVDREDFEASQQMLRHTRARLEKLEAHVAELEARESAD